MPRGGKLIEFDTSQVINNLKRIQGGTKQDAAAALYQEATKVMADSNPLVPKDTGALVNSGYVDKPQIRGNDVSVEMGYGGPAVKYAEKQHEEESYRHNPGQQAKYLEEPFEANKEGFYERVEKRMFRSAAKRVR